METLEAYLFWNAVMDAMIVASAARVCGKEKPVPILIAAVLGAAYAVVCRYFSKTAVSGVPVALGVGALMAWIAVLPRDLREALRAICALYAAAVFAGGAQLLAARAFGGTLGGMCGALAGTGLFLWAGRVRSARLSAWDVSMWLRTAEGSVRFRALVDTGNRLHEPISGLPVLIAEARALRRALPEGFDAREAAKKPPPGFRLVSYGVLGGAGTLACFKPESLLVTYGDGWLRAPDVWVAVYPGRIPGQVSALAPTVIGTIETAGAPPYWTRGE